MAYLNIITMVIINSKNCHRTIKTGGVRKAFCAHLRFIIKVYRAKLNISWVILTMPNQLVGIKFIKVETCRQPRIRKWGFTELRYIIYLSRKKIINKLSCSKILGIIFTVQIISYNDFLCIWLSLDNTAWT